MEDAERRMKANSEWLSQHQNTASRVTKGLIKSTAILEYIRSGCNPQATDAVTHVGQALLEAESLICDMDSKAIPHEIIYLSLPGVVSTVKKTIEGDSLHIEWEDPDGGQSEILRYLVRHRQGRVGEWHSLCVTEP